MSNQEREELVALGVDALRQRLRAQPLAPENVNAVGQLIYPPRIAVAAALRRRAAHEAKARDRDWLLDRWFQGPLIRPHLEKAYGSTDDVLMPSGHLLETSLYDHEEIHLWSNGQPRVALDSALAPVALHCWREAVPDIVRASRRMRYQPVALRNLDRAAVAEGLLK